MVLASNEWLNNSEDEEKPQTERSNITTTATTTSSTTTTTTSSEVIATATNTTSSTVNVAVTTIPTTAAIIAKPAISTITTITGSINNKTNGAGASSAAAITESVASAPVTETVPLNSKLLTTNKKITDNNSIGSTKKQSEKHITNKRNQQNTTQRNRTKINVKNSPPPPPPPPYDLQENKFAVINVDNILTVMSENTAIESIKISDSDSFESDNNSFLNILTSSNTTLTNANDINDANSNTNTLQSSLMLRQSKSVPSIPSADTTQQPQSIISSNNISPQILSNALKSITISSSGIGVATGIGTNNNNNNNNNLNFINAFTASLNKFGVTSATINNTDGAFFDAITTGSQAPNSNNSSSSGGSSGGAAITNIVNNQRTEITSSSIIENNGLAKIILLCESNSHPFQQRTIFLTPNVECKVGRLIAKSKASDTNAIFDCKVLSRNHAVLWYSDDGKFWVKDTKSSNGTYINDNKLGNEAAELHFGDIVKFGVDVLENSRKEVHGCIIACVKLYMPDGREAISIDLNTHRSLYSGEGVITFDELHRLSLYMQEASQRELVLQSKLFNIQNVLDATRKNSALCWQSMVAEDQLLHRIHLLEKKLQIMEKNVPESTLRNEIFKLLDDKSSYQQTAKEALRKVYQERCDAMQMLSKMESGYRTSENECKILREQIVQSKDTIQEVNNRLTNLEIEYNDYKDDVERQQLKANQQEDQAMAKLIETVQQREYECDALKQRIDELMSRNLAKNLNENKMIDNHQQQQQQQQHEQNISNNDADEKRDRTKIVTTLADVDEETIDIADNDDENDDDDDEDDDDDDDDDDDGDDNNDDNDDDDNEKDIDECFTFKSKNILDKETDKKVCDVDENIVGDNVDNKEDDKCLESCQITDNNILKWLRNSDLNKQDGSNEIFNAIISNDSDDSSDETVPSTSSSSTQQEQEEKLKDKNDVKKSISKTKIDHQKFGNILKTIETNLKQIDNVADDDDDDAENGDDDDNAANNDAILKSKSIKNKKYILLIKSITLLNDAFNELININNNTEEEIEENAQPKTIDAVTIENADDTATPQINDNVELEIKTSGSSISSDNSRSSIIALKCNNNEEHIEKLNVLHTNAVPNTKEFSLTVNESNENGVKNFQNTAEKLQKLEEEIIDYRDEILQLNDRIELLNRNAKKSEENIQTEYNTLRNEIIELTDISASLMKEKENLENTIYNLKLQKEAAEIELLETTSKLSSTDIAITATTITTSAITTPVTTTTTTTATSTKKATAVKEQQQQEQQQENVLKEFERKYVETGSNTGIYNFEEDMKDDFAAINSNVMQREEELITYKEYLEKLQKDNIYLRNEITDLKVQANSQILTILKRFLPYIAVFLAIIIYFFNFYY